MRRDLKENSQKPDERRGKVFWGPTETISKYLLKPIIIIKRLQHSKYKFKVPMCRVSAYKHYTSFLKSKIWKKMFLVFVLA